MTIRSKMPAAGLAALVALFSVAPAVAGPKELNVLTSYIGDWRGAGALVGGGKSEPFTCRLSVAKGNAEKINYTGRCSLVSANLSISGTIAFNDQAQRYEAAMSSNAGFTGLAVGRLQGERISFDLQERDKDRSGSDVRIGSKILLANGDITVDFEVEFNDSGEVLRASVPFSQ
ncbi:heme-binding beta-barrel domain-containing protein [Devosia submarina]|uniref:heme-binding beta-barrel domain-containing protein n=1 Tax=Devosia submarina TaxID=1173082 RepID=UPI000D37C62F|nr:heme-binding beta-barrel domain-containing protein [Devosia submarina]